MHQKLNFPRLIRVLQYKTTDIIPYIKQTLERLHYEVLTDDDNYIIGVPETLRHKSHPRVCFVAHMDVVSNRKEPPKIELNGLRLKNTGGGCLGADDRAGVFAILENIEYAKYKPLVIFTNYEEVGGRGVKHLCSAAHKAVFEPYAEFVDLFVEPDRMRGNEYVWYSNVCPKVVHQWAQSFGFKPDHGSYSDVKTLTETYKKPHINISVGYRNQHGPEETLDISELMFTIRAMSRMLASRIPVHVMSDSDISTPSYYGTGYEKPANTAARRTTSATAPKEYAFRETYKTYEEFKNCPKRKEFEKNRLAAKNTPATTTPTTPVKVQQGQASKVFTLGSQHPSMWSEEDWATFKDSYFEKPAETQAAPGETKLTRESIQNMSLVEAAIALQKNYADDSLFDGSLDNLNSPVTQTT